MTWTESLLHTQVLMKNVMQAEILYAPEINLQIIKSRPGEDLQSAAESRPDCFYLWRGWNQEHK